MSAEAKNASSQHLETNHSKVPPHGQRERKGTPSGSIPVDELASDSEDKRVLNGKRTRGEGKSLNCGSAGVKKRSLGMEQKSYLVTTYRKMYKNLPAFRRHTCVPECRGYYICEFKGRKVLSLFRKLLAELFGRSGRDRPFSLYIEYSIFEIRLSEEELKIMRGHHAVKNIELSDGDKPAICW